jgi:hypothetical protein
MKPKLLIGLAGLGLASASSASFYQLDDGVSDTSLSTSGSGLNAIYITQYTVAAGGEMLTSIDIVWGDRFAVNMANGTPVQVLLLNDPNNDGNPNDSTVVQSISTTAINVGSDTFNNYAITPVTMAVGTSFFVGGFIPDMVSGTSWCAIDSNATGMGTRNFWQPQGIPGSTSYIGLDVFGANLTFMVRANASPVPEPATLAVLGIGAVVMIRRRKRA